MDFPQLLLTRGRYLSCTVRAIKLRAPLRKENIVRVDKSLADGTCQALEKEHSVRGLPLENLVQAFPLNLDQLARCHAFRLGRIQRTADQAGPIESLS